MLLALGLNVVVGWGGLLDLGFVAFYGIGAYTYAILDSDKFGYHLPTLVAVPFVVRHRGVRRAAARPAVAAPDRRLPRDRDALLLAALPDADDERRQRLGHNLTGGPNGILSVDPFHLFGHELAVQHERRLRGLVSLRRARVLRRRLRRAPLRQPSRTGRAWRSLREDSLAAEAMGMPVNWLKLMSFAFGAAVAALTGTLFAALNASVFPLTFYFMLLITVYTMVILGGSGSQPGVVLGAIIISVLLEMLRDPGKSRAPLLRSRCSADSSRVPLLAAARARRSRRDRLRLRVTRACACAQRGLGGGREGRRCRAAGSRTGSSSRRTSTAGSRRSRTSA